MPKMRSVFSGSIAQIGYDHETQELHVKWSGSDSKTSIYAGVPEDVAHQTMNARSVGSAVHHDIKPNYLHRYL